MPTYRKITGNFMGVGQIPMSRQPVKVEHLQRSDAGGVIFPADSDIFYTDADGNVEFTVWCNEEGGVASQYRITLPDGSYFDTVVPVGTSDLELSVLEDGGVASADPQYQTLITFILNEIGSAGGTVPLASATVAGRVKTNTTDADPVVYLKSEVDTALATKADSSALSGYVTTAGLNTTLAGYVTNSSLTTTLDGYATTASLSNYVTTANLTTALGSYLLTSTRGAVNGVASLDASALIPVAQIPTAIARLTQVTASQVGNTTAQWNANQIQGRNISSAVPTVGQVLKFDGSAWTPQADSTGGGGGTLDDLTDVIITSPTNGQVLSYNGTTWVNSTGGGSGEINTASNVGAGGVGIFRQKTGVNLEFRNINAGSNRVTVSLDSTNNEVDIDVNQANLTLTSIGGTLSVAKGGTGATTTSAALTALGAASTTALTSHTSSTSNPHSVTAAQVGAIPSGEKGSANGVATLDAGGLIPDTQIPSGITRDSELTAHTSLTNNPHSVTAVQVGAIASSERGVANGVASLDANTLVPDAQIPTGIARLATAQQFTATQGLNANTITYSVTPTADLSLSNRHYLTLTGNVTTFDASNLREGMFTFHFIQDGTGGRTLSFDSKFRILGGTPTLSTAANARDILSCDCDGTNLYCVLNKGW